MSNSVIACCLVSALATALRVSADASGPNDGLEHGLRIEPFAIVLSNRIGDIEAVGETVQPVVVLVAETLGRRRPPQRLAQPVQGRDHAADVCRC